MRSIRPFVLSQAVTAGVVVIVIVSLLLLAAPNRLAAESQSEVQGGLLTRFINKTPAEALAESPAAYSIGGGPNVAGIYMPNTSFNRFHTGFTLPPDYAAGTDLTLRIMWANGNANAVNCNFVLWANSATAYRPGTTAFAYIAGLNFSNGQDKITLAAGATAQAVRAEEVVIVGAGVSSSLQPGDALQIAIARPAADVADTCTGSLVIVGLDATYQSVGSFLPVVTR